MLLLMCVFRFTFFLPSHRVLYQIYKLPQSSLAELARNSVIQSGFEMELKRQAGIVSSARILSQILSQVPQAL